MILHYRSICGFILALCALSLLPSMAQAEVLRGFVTGDGLADASTPAVYYSATAYDNFALTLGPLTGQVTDLGGRQTIATSSVTGSVFLNNLLGLYAQSQSNSNVLSHASAFGAYRDIIYLSGLQNLPSLVRINFQVHAFLGVTTLLPAGGGNAGLSVGYLGYDEQSAFAPNVASAAFNLQSGLFPQGFTSTNNSSSNFIGNYSFTAGFDSGRGGYAFQTTAAVATTSYASIDTADALSTISLVSVTYADGSPITGGTITFASGVEPVPEPSTAVLTGTILLVLAGAARRRYK